MNILTLLDTYCFPVFSRINKRLRFVISVLTLLGFMIFSTFFFFESVWLFIPLFVALVYFLTYFSILEGIEKKEWIMLFLMPVIVTIAFYLFFFLFPIRWLTRIPFMFLYGFAIYAILLTSNIFNVGVERTLQLFRAAFAVNYFFQTVVFFLLLSVVLAFRQSFIVNTTVVGILAFVMGIQLLWSVKPKIYIEKRIYIYSMFMAVIVGEIGTVVSFLPIKPAIGALFLTGCYYCLSGIIYHYFDEKLFKFTIREYSIVLGVVIVLLFLSISW